MQLFESFPSCPTLEDWGRYSGTDKISVFSQGKVDNILSKMVKRIYVGTTCVEGEPVQKFQNYFLDWPCHTQT